MPSSAEEWAFGSTPDSITVNNQMCGVGHETIAWDSSLQDEVARRYVRCQPASAPSLMCFATDISSKSGEGGQRAMRRVSDWIGEAVTSERRPLSLSIQLVASPQETEIKALDLHALMDDG